MAQQFLFDLYDAVKVTPRRLSLHMPVLGQVPPRPRLLRPERWSNRIDAADTHNQRLSVQLPALGQVRFLIEIFHLEQRRSTFHGSRAKSWNMNLHEIVLVKPFANRR